jgi:hypothetical protein
VLALNDSKENSLLNEEVLKATGLAVSTISIQISKLAARPGEKALNQGNVVIRCIDKNELFTCGERQSGGNSSCAHF